MELKTTNDQICINEILFNGTIEESIELDYLLPDYFSNIFKILKSKITPKILSKRISSDKLVIDGIADIRIIYVAEETNHIKCINHKMSFTKTVDLKSNCDNPIVFVSAKSDYMNCRVVNPKRVDIRGSVNCKVKVINQVNRDIISDACNMGMQIRKKLITVGYDRKETERLFNIKEDIQLGTSNKKIQNILLTNAEALVTDYKIIPNKIIVKGEVLLHIIYETEEEKGEIFCEDKKVQISQILDILGVDEEYSCCIKLDVNNIQFDKREETEENKYICELGIGVICSTIKSKNIQIIKDIYSTCYETNMDFITMKNERLRNTINENRKINCSLEIDNDNLSMIYDTFIEFSANKIEDINGKIGISGQLNFSILGLDNENMPVIIDKTMDHIIDTDIDYPMHNINIDINISPINVSSEIMGSKIDINIELNLTGCIYDCIEENVVFNINIDVDKCKKRNSNCALIAYYAEKNECVWDIAKKYNTSIEGIMNENSLENDLLENKKMILIPIVD